MTEYDLKEFINKVSPSGHEDLWFKCVNFIYTSDDSCFNSLSAETLKAIKESKNKDKEDAVVDLLGAYNLEISTDEIQDSDEIIESFNDNIDNNWLKWKNCVLKQIKIPKRQYLRKLKESDGPINYIIFSEAPMLTWKKEQLPISNYIFKECNIKGSYRSAPFKAFGNELEKKQSVTNTQLIDVLSDKRVAMIDLLDLPFPISSELRRKWSYEIKIGEKPLSIIFLENAIEQFMKESGLKFSDKPEFAFMMPPITAVGIIDYFFKSKKDMEIKNKETKLILKWEEVTQCNSRITKEQKNFLNEEILPLYSRISTAGSNNPNENLLKHALNL